MRRMHCETEMQDRHTVSTRVRLRQELSVASGSKPGVVRQFGCSFGSSAVTRPPAAVVSDMKLPAGYVPGLLQQHKATAKGGFGERLLRQYGWTEGKGLGANETGIAEALRVKQKKDQTGVSCTLILLFNAMLQPRSN